MSNSKFTNLLKKYNLLEQQNSNLKAQKQDLELQIKELKSRPATETINKTSKIIELEQQLIAIDPSVYNQTSFLHSKRSHPDINPYKTYLEDCLKKELENGK